jgi:MFS family permease
VGALVDRFGVRVPIALGTALLACGFSVLVSMSEPWHFVAANVLLGPGFAAAAMLPIVVAVTVTVRERTAFALGIVGTGSSAGALVLAPLVQAIVGAFGWRAAYAALGTAVVLTPIPFLLFALPRGRLAREAQGPGAGGERPRLRDELRRPGVLALAGLLVVPGLVSFGLQVHLVPLLSDLGHPASFAAGALGAAVGISALGKLGGGALGDRIGALGGLRLALAAKLFALALLPLAAASSVVAIFVVVHGLAVGAQIAVVPVIALGVLGREHFATLFGLLQLAATLAVALAPVIPGFVFDATGSYAGAIAFWVIAMAAALALSLRLRFPTPFAGDVAAPSTGLEARAR